jgi:hypothetical protein
VKPVGVSEKFCLLDVATPSHGFHVAGVTVAHAAQVPAFDYLSDDSSPDVHKTPSPAKTVEKCASPPPSVFGEFLRFSFALLPWVLIIALQMLPGIRPHWICHWRM